MDSSNRWNPRTNIKLINNTHNRRIRIQRDNIKPNTFNLPKTPHQNNIQDHSYINNHHHLHSLTSKPPHNKHHNKIHFRIYPTSMYSPTRTSHNPRSTHNHRLLNPTKSI